MCFIYICTAFAQYLKLLIYLFEHPKNKQSMRKHVLLLVLALFAAVSTFAQVTTGSITGTVKDSKGLPLPGATIVATHVPSGTTYNTAAKANGQYTIPNMRVGGPYTVKVSFVGFEPRTFSNLTLSLGTPLKIEVVLAETGKALAEVTVSGAKKGSVISPERNGTSTHVSQAELQSLPTISRSIQDFARLTPQAVANYSSSDGSPLGITFAGQNNRYNQFTIDGANATDVFGLSASGVNGGQAGINPIPLEAIQEVQILLSPYDVTQGGFTGGGINAVTKSGTNTFHGSAYTYLQNQNFIGKSVTNGAKYQNFKANTYGVSIGGPIVKNKLFFYLNGERYDNKAPLAFDPTQVGSGSNFDPNVLAGISKFLKTTYQYDPGSYGAINREQYSNSIFGRLDWNIDDKNRLTFRQSYVDGSNYIISRTANSMTFANGGYYFKSKTASSVLELNSNFSSSASNVLRITFNNVRDARTSSPFPNVSITQNGLTYNFGADFSSSANALTQNNFTLQDNFTLYKGNHAITFGTEDEFYNTNNIFMQAYNGAYTYNKNTSGYDNIAAFELNNAAPSAYTLNYDPANPGNKFGAKIHAAQIGVYGQDIWSIKDNFKLTYGLRIDMPVFFNKPVANAAFNSDPNWGGIQNNQTPKFTPLFSPRVGFNWDVNSDGQTQLRGGAGLFTGRIPFVWISNQYGTNGVSVIKYTTVPSTLRFNYNPNATLSGAYVPSGNTPPATEVDVTAHNFKFPQTLRGNLAIDQKLPIWGLIGTLEGIYTKTINNINYQNLNIAAQSGNVTIGGSSRPWYNFTRVDSKFTDVVELTNTSVGYAYNLTASITKPMSNGWTGGLAYTYGQSFSLNDGTSSVAMSNWRFAYNVRGLNYLDEARSNYDPGSRVIAHVSKTFRYAHDHMATTIGLVYTGQSGVPFSYTYTKNINGDDITGKTGNNNANLVYVPSAAELNDPAGYLNYKLVDLTVTSGGVTTITRTAAQEWSDLKDFINSQAGLKKNEGKVIARNGDRTPWENHVDLKIAQDFYVYKNHKLQVSFDMLNVGNFLNKNWGWSYGASNQDVSLFTVVSQSTNPTFTFDKTKLNLVNGVYRPYFINDFTSRWRGQLSVRYSF